VFVKVALDRADFRREILGHQIARELSRENNWIGAVPVIIEDEGEGLVVTRAAQGQYLADIVRSSLRLDKNPLRRRHRIARAATSLELLGRWIKKFFQVQLPSADVLSDKSPHSIRQRALRNLAYIRSISTHRRQKLDQLDATLRECQIPTDNVLLGLVHGDLNAGNILISDSQITVIDFEDIGAGPALYDCLWLRESFSRTWASRSYVWLRSPLMSLPIPQFSNRLIALYRIDFELLYLRQLAHRAISGSRWAHISANLNAIAVRHKISELMASFRGAKGVDC
jgi:aminoglycoside phosphotransferase (APT) family kinase protein